jgi:hypothetical protein
MKSTKLFYGDTRLKDVYVGATKWEVFKFRTARRVRKLAIICFMLDLLVGGYELGSLHPKTVYADREVVKEVEVDAKSPVLDRIAKCESNNTHFAKNGQVLVKVNTNGTTDTGKYQINSIWGAQATKLGLNLYDEHDNEAFAKWLYANKGTEPWSASAKCWSK